MIYDILTTETAQIWKQERAVFYGQNTQEFAEGSTVTLWTDLHGSEDAPLATYICDENNSVTIDLTDYIRTFPNAENLYFGGSNFESPVSIDYHIMGLIDPAKMIIPPHDGDELGALIVPPRRVLYLYTPISINTIFYADDITGWTYAGLDSSDWGVVQNRLYSMIDGIKFRKNGEVFRFPVEEFDECNRYAILRWMSSVGKTQIEVMKKTHIFFISEQKITSADDYSLDMFDNAFNATKGREETLTLYLDKLDAYDLWYYSDILTSSDVQLLWTDGHDWRNIIAGVSDDGIQVEVTTKNVTIPSGEKADGKIEFEIKVKRYDAVSL